MGKSYAVEDISGQRGYSSYFLNCHTFHICHSLSIKTNSNVDNIIFAKPNVWVPFDLYDFFIR